MNQTSHPRNSRSHSMPRGKTSGSMIRLGVLFLILLGVGIFGWIRRPDLVRNYLGINAPAWNTTQALKFANNELFTLGTKLTEAEVVFLDQGQNSLVAMIENGGGSRTITAETVRNDPAAFGARCVKNLDQVKRDTSRALTLLDAKTFRTSGDQGSLWKTLDLAEQVQRSIGVLGTSDLGKTFTEQKADKTITDIIEELKKIQMTTSPHQRTIDTDAAPPRWAQQLSQSGHGRAPCQICRSNEGRGQKNERRQAQGHERRPAQGQGQVRMITGVSEGGRASSTGPLQEYVSRLVSSLLVGIRRAGGPGDPSRRDFGICRATRAG